MVKVEYAPLGSSSKQFPIVSSFRRHLHKIAMSLSAIWAHLDRYDRNKPVTKNTREMPCCTAVVIAASMGPLWNIEDDMVG